MKFAVFKYCKSAEDLNIAGILKKLPKGIQDFYIEKKNPYISKEFKILEAEGYEITLPLLSTEPETNFLKADSIIKKTIKDALSLGVEIAVFPNDMVYSTDIKAAEGKALFAFFVSEAAKKLLRSIEKDIKTAEFVLIDGGNFLTDLVLDSLYPEVNYLSIYTDRVENFEKRQESIYEDTGLNIQLFSSVRNPAMKEADVIINASGDLENYDYFFKSGSIYLDINKNTQKLKRIMRKRDDMVFVDGISFKYNESYFKGSLLEAYFYVSNEEFRTFITKEYSLRLQKSIMEFLSHENISAASFYCMEKQVSQRDFLRAKNK